MIKTMRQVSEAKTSDPQWTALYKVGGAAALVAGFIFRRNLGVEIALFSTPKQPDNVSDWFKLLKTNRFLGLAYLNIFDIINYALVALMFIALYAVLRPVNKSYPVLALASGLLGIGVYFASNTAFSLLTLSDQYAVATTDAHKTQLLAAGQALLALNPFSSAGAYPGAGGYLSLFLIAAAGMVISVVMMQSKVFGKPTVYMGLLANGLDLGYCLAFAFVPAAVGEILAVMFIPAAGLFFFFWHVMVGWKLWQLGHLAGKVVSNKPVTVLPQN